MLSAFRDLFHYNREFAIGAILILIVLCMAVASFFSPYQPELQYVVPFDVPPSWEYPFGTNSRGQDVFWQLTFAIRNSLFFGVTVAILSRFISLVVGLTAGYIGGFVGPGAHDDQRHLRGIPALSDPGARLFRLQGPYVVADSGDRHGFARLAV